MKSETIHLCDKLLHRCDTMLKSETLGLVTSFVMGVMLC